jgi:TMEM175 potassium channel family protein
MPSLVAMSSDTDRKQRADDLPNVDRLLTLSDGVVAIALTLLVLQLRVPSPVGVSHTDSASWLASALARDTDQLVAYVISFYVIAHFWLIHHRVFRQLVGQQEGLAWWNFAFLFTITIMPFTSDLLGQYASNPLAVDIFALNLLLASAATQAVLEIAIRRGLVTPPSQDPDRRAGLLRTAGAVLVLGASMGVAWWNTDLAKYLWLLLALVPRLVDLWLKLRAKRRADQAAGRTGG